MKKKKLSIVVNAIQCLECGDIIYSRDRHDDHSCSCGACSIDGGRDYTKVNANDLNRVIHKKINVQATQNQLYYDWNMREDLYGLIPAPKNWASPPIKKSWKETVFYFIKHILSMGKF